MTLHAPDPFQAVHGFFYAIFADGISNAASDGRVMPNSWPLVSALPFRTPQRVPVA